MTPTVLFYILILIIIFNYCWESYLDKRNANHYNDDLPEEIKDVYDKEKYEKSQKYKQVNHKLSSFQSAFSFLMVLIFFFFDGFAYVDGLARSITQNSILVGLLFFGIIFFALDLIMLPFSYYKTFKIENDFDFNTMTVKIFVLDKIKGWVMGTILGGGILALIIWFYELTGSYFWLLAWGVVAAFSLFMLLFYSKLIVPLFNKQTPLEENSLREKIENYAKKVDFQLDNIYIIDGSKRSKKSNAYFSGFGKQKRITLFDTLVDDLEEEEIVAVLAHEVGHYKNKHTIYNLLISIASMGVTFWLLSLLIDSPMLSQALNVSIPSFHIGLLVFAVLYSPISSLTGFFMNKLSRKFEYQADAYAKKTYEGKYLVSSLKKLSRNNLSNLTPDKLFVKINYSHPTILQRIKALQTNF